MDIEAEQLLHESGELEAIELAAAEVPPPRRRGRPRTALTVPFNSRLLLMTHPSQLTSGEQLTFDDPTATGAAVKCGLCLRNVDKSRFDSHLAEHYGVGWIVGEPPIDITNRADLIIQIVHYMKTYKYLRMYCRMCAASFRSARTILKHLEECARPPTV